MLLAGPNGAGKTTLLKAVSGLIPAASREVVFDGRGITGVPAHRIARLGLRQVPEGRRVWPTLTVREHLQLAWHDVPHDRRQALPYAHRVYVLDTGGVALHGTVDELRDNEMVRKAYLSV